MKFEREVVVASALGLSLLFMAERVLAGAPTDQLQGTADRVLVILQEVRSRSQSYRNEHVDKLRELIHARFDFTEMARRSLGAHWRERTPDERKEFMEIFPKFLEDSYVDKIDSYSGEKILYEKELLDKDFAEVQTKIVTKNGEQYSVDYRLRLVDDTWKVYDVIIEGISLVSNYRSQFNRVISKSSYKELLRAMKEKQIKAAAGSAKK